MLTRNYRVEPRKKSSPRWIWIVAGVLAAAVVGLAYWFGPRLYYMATGDAILRIQAKVEELEPRLARSGQNRDELLESIHDIRKLVEIHGRNNPAAAEFFYYQGLLDFYELCARVPLDDDSLIQLTGRGYLPQTTDAMATPAPQLALRMSRRMRKALALDPALKQAAAARLALVYGDLFYTGRTDLQLIDQLNLALSAELSPAQQRLRDWIAFALYAILGKNTELNQLAAELRAPPAADQAPRLQLSDAARNLSLAHGALHARAYLQALYLAREVKRTAADRPLYTSEAARVEGEVFLLQRGALAAQPYFEEALALAGGADPFIEERLATLKATAP